MALVFTRRDSFKLVAAAYVLVRPARGAFRHFPEDGDWIFVAEAAGEPVGEHRIAFRRSGSEFLVRSDSRWTATEAYEQHVEERWVDGWLRGLVSDTRYGAESWQVRAEWQNGALRGYRVGKAFSVSGYSIAHTLWHPDSPHVRELLDPRDAKLKIINSYELGVREILVEGQARPATGHGLYGSIRADLWYDAEGALLAAMVTLPDGTSVDLRLEQVIETRSG